MSGRGETIFQLIVVAIFAAETAPLVWLALRWGWPWYLAWPAAVLAGSALCIATIMVGFWLAWRCSRRAGGDRPFPPGGAP